MAETLVVEPDLLDSTALHDAFRIMLRLGAVLYVAADGLDGNNAQMCCTELQRRLPGARVTYLPRHSMSGPVRLYGFERLRIENKEGAQ